MMGRALAALLLALSLLSCRTAQPSAVPLGGGATPPTTDGRAPSAGVAQDRTQATEPAAPAATAPTTTAGSPAPTAPAVAQQRTPRVGTTSTRVTFMEFDLRFAGEVDGTHISGDMKGENREELVYEVTRVEDGAITELELSYALASERMVGMGLDERENGPLHGKTYRVVARGKSLTVHDSRRRLAPEEEATAVESDAREFLEMAESFAELNGAGGAEPAAPLEAARKLVQTSDDVAVKNLKVEFRRLDRTRAGEQTAVFEGGCDIALTEGGVAVKGHMAGSVVLFTTPWRQHSVRLEGPVEFNGATESGDPMTGRGRAKIEVLFR